MFGIQSRLTFLKGSGKMLFRLRKDKKAACYKILFKKMDRFRLKKFIGEESTTRMVSDLSPSQPVRYLCAHVTLCALVRVTSETLGARTGMYTDAHAACALPCVSHVRALLRTGWHGRIFDSFFQCNSFN
jgi:hypothetical protein